MFGYRQLVVTLLYCSKIHRKEIDPEATRTTGNAQGFEEGYAQPSATYGFDIKVSF